MTTTTTTTSQDATGTSPRHALAQQQRLLQPLIGRHGRLVLWPARPKSIQASRGVGGGSCDHAPGAAHPPAAPHLLMSPRCLGATEIAAVAGGPSIKNEN